MVSLPLVYPILDTAFVQPNNGESRAEALRRMILSLYEGGVTLLQYRNKTGTGDEIQRDAELLRSLLPASDVRLILNDHPRLAVQVDFDGVHLGQTDMSPTEARAILGPDRMIGYSTHNEKQVKSALSQPVDYLAIGPVFATSSKADPDPVVGLEGVRMAWGHTAMPVVAIGGITRQNAAEVLAAGASSVAVLSAICASQEPGKVYRDFCAQLK